MNALMQSFEFEASPVRVVTIDDRSWWVATDLAGLLGYRTANDMTRILDDDQKGTHNLRTLGGSQELTIITEGGMWRCVFGSRREEAKRFRRWVEDVLLPTLRATGQFIIEPSANEDTPDAATLDAEDRWKAGLQLVREARLLGGRGAARRAWTIAGLPDVFNEGPAQALIAQSGIEPGVASWFAERCERAPGCRVGTSELFADYERWTDGNDVDAVSLTAFGRLLNILGLASVRSNRIYRVGVRLQAK